MYKIILVPFIFLFSISVLAVEKKSELKCWIGKITNGKYDEDKKTGGPKVLYSNSISLEGGLGSFSAEVASFKFEANVQYEYGQATIKSLEITDNKNGTGVGSELYDPTLGGRLILWKDFRKKNGFDLNCGIWTVNYFFVNDPSSFQLPTKFDKK